MIYGNGIVVFRYSRADPQPMKTSNKPITWETVGNIEAVTSQYYNALLIA